jgi:hypothetical protein
MHLFPQLLYVIGANPRDILATRCWFTPLNARTSACSSECVGLKRFENTVHKQSDALGELLYLNVLYPQSEARNSLQSASANLTLFLYISLERKPTDRWRLWDELPCLRALALSLNVLTDCFKARISYRTTKIAPPLL